MKLKVRVIPGAGRDEFGGLREGAVVVRVQSRAVKGAANKALIKFLSKALGLSTTDISIATGHRSRDKTLHILGLDAAQLKQRLRQAGAL